MIDLATLDALNRQAARRSLREGILPVLISGAALARVGSISELHKEGFRLPYIGCRKPRGFRPLGPARMVDISGWGADDERALSFDQTLRWMRELTAEHGTLAWATVEMGQFQAYLQPYKVKG